VRLWRCARRVSAASVTPPLQSGCDHRVS
jgi:hypothetical protein